MIDWEDLWVSEGLSTLLSGDAFVSSSALRIVGGTGLSGGTSQEDEDVWLGDVIFFSFCRLLSSFDFRTMVDLICD